MQGAGGEMESASMEHQLGARHAPFNMGYTWTRVSLLPRTSCVALGK